ncbi:MAG TPA: CHAD domain-containing protein [Candidatus Angelobacter sp.]
MKAGTNNDSVTNAMPGLLVAAITPSVDSAKGGVQEAWEWIKLRKIVRRQIDKFISLVPDTLRGGNLGAVTEMRITSRRLEQILDLLYPRPRPRRIKKLRRQLKACRRTLGKLRNYDALLTMVDECITTTGPSDGEAWKAVREYLEKLKVQHAPAALEKLGRMNLTASYLKLKQDLDSEDLFRLVAGNGDLANLKVDGGKNLITKRITTSLDHRWRAFEAAVEKSRNDPREEVIHRMRIAAKRLRYLTEAMEKLHVNGSSEIVSWLQSFQRTVGRWHDRELLEHAMSDMLAKSGFCLGHPRLVQEVQKLIARNHEAKEALERKFSWMTSRSRHFNETREWVSQLLTNGNGNGANKATSH